MPHKRTSKQENRRIDHKKDRAAVRSILGGGHPTQPQHMNWSSKAEPIPVMDDRMPAKGRRGRCKRSPNGKHTAVYNHGRRSVSYGSGDYKWTRFIGPEHVCMYCGKHKHGYRSGQWNEPKIPPAPSPMPFLVVTDNNGTVAGYANQGLAIVDADARNQMAVDLGIETRYHVEPYENG